MAGAAAKRSTIDATPYDMLYDMLSLLEGECNSESFVDKK